MKFEFEHQRFISIKYIWNYLEKLVVLFRPQCINSLRPSDAYMRRQFNHHWFRKWLVAWSAPSHYLIQCWDIINWTLRNKLQWNVSRNYKIFIQENVFESVVCEMASILFRPQCVNADSSAVYIMISYVKREILKKTSNCERHSFTKLNE